MGSLSKKWGKVKRWNSFLHQIFFCTICSSNQFNPRIKDLASQRKVHHEIILGTNVEVDFSAFVPSNGNLFCVKEQLMMLYITDFLCAGHRCPANWRPRKDIIYLFPFFGGQNILKNGKFSCFYVVEWGSFCGSEERRRWHFTTDISSLNLTDRGDFAKTDCSQKRIFRLKSKKIKKYAKPNHGIFLFSPWTGIYHGLVWHISLFSYFLA